jgi:hypothetical protein
VVFAAAFAPAPAQALGSAFSCTAVTYQVVGAQLKIGAVDNGELTYTNVGSAHTSSYNAGGYNTVDNFIYALEGSPANLLKVASDGTVESNAVTGVTGSTGFVAGDVSTDGESLIAYNSIDDSVWNIDLDTFAGTEIGNLGSADVGDFAIVTDGGATTAYGIDTVTGNLQFFDPTANPIIIDNNSSVEIGPGIAKGAVWADSSGNLTVFVNTTGDVYSVKNPSANSPTVNKVASLGTVTFGNDGMKCALAASAFPEPDESNEELAATGLSTVDFSVMALTGIALVVGGSAILRTRRRESL